MYYVCNFKFERLNLTLSLRLELLFKVDILYTLVNKHNRQLPFAVSSRKLPVNNIPFSLSNSSYLILSCLPAPLSECECSNVKSK